MTNLRSIRKKLVEKINKTFPVKKIILFGSYARGETTKDSDIDLLVITEEKISFEERIRRKSVLQEEFDVPLHIMWITYYEFLETKDVIGGIAFPAAKYGEVIYEEP
jgi:predicted nucleotidyltransferase